MPILRPLRQLQARRAFERTKPHPMDPLVRLADRPDDLVALFDARASAVIWRDEPSKAMREAVRDMRHHRYDMLLNIKKHWRGGYAFGRDQELLKMPNIVQTDMLSVLEMHDQLCGKILAPNKYVSCLQSDGSGDILADLSIFKPHVDGSKRGDTRIIKTYAEHDDQTTEWFPGMSGNKALMKTAANKFWDAANDRDAAKAEYNRQFVGAYNVVFFKKDVPKRPDWIAFAHASPLPQIGKRRAALVSR